MKDKTLIPVFDPRHALHTIIFWDTQAKEYYNKSSDIYLSADDVKFHGLPPAYANLPDVVMGPSNSIDIYGPQGTVVQVEHTADTFSVGLDDGTVLFNLELQNNKWEQTNILEDLEKFKDVFKELATLMKVASEPVVDESGNHVSDFDQSIHKFVGEEQPMNWELIKKRTSLYEIKCCPSCGKHLLQERVEGPSWVCRYCHVSFIITNPSYLKRKKPKHGNQNTNS